MYNLADKSFAALIITIQEYDICFRREENYCRTCFSPKFAQSFGVGITGAATPVTGLGGSACDGTTAGKTDYVEIPGAQLSTQSSTTSQYTAQSATVGYQRICGHFFSNLAAGTAGATICSKYQRLDLEMKVHPKVR